MILAETQYKTYDSELLTIVKAFKTWHHYFKNFKHEAFILTNHDNLRHFIDTKNLSFRQVCWAQKLSQYHFQTNYCQGKANVAIDGLLRFIQKNQDKKNKLRDENGQIFIVCKIYWPMPA